MVVRMSSQPAPTAADTPEQTFAEGSNEAYVESLRAERNRLWDKVAPHNSTRWDLTQFEKADDAYVRAACHYGIRVIPHSEDAYPNMTPVRSAS